MISTLVRDHLKIAFDTVYNWSSTFSEAERVQLAMPELQRQIGRSSYVDAYYRIREHVPLILKVIGILDQSSDKENAKFWLDHLEEEYGHDEIMRRDIVAMVGDERDAIKLLEQTPITPPSAAVVGFIHWQVRHNNPHLLIVYRMFFETFIVELDDRQAATIHDLFPAGSATLRLHREADKDHADKCLAYLDKNFNSADLATVVWILDFIALCLRESQSWIAAQVLGQHP